MLGTCLLQQKKLFIKQSVSCRFKISVMSRHRVNPIPLILLEGSIHSANQDEDGMDCHLSESFYGNRLKRFRVGTKQSLVEANSEYYCYSEGARFFDCSRVRDSVNVSTLRKWFWYTDNNNIGWWRPDIHYLLPKACPASQPQGRFENLSYLHLPQ